MGRGTREGHAPSPAEETLATFSRAHVAGLSLSFLASVLLFWPTIRELVRTWATDPNYSHGFVVPVVATAILVADRERLAATNVERSFWGLAALLVSLLVFSLGYATSTNILQRLALWGTLTGGVWFLFGFELLRRKPFPFFLLLFAIPPPTAFFIPFSTNLRELAAQLAAGSLRLLGFDVSRAGSILTVGDQELEVVDACSGIRSLMSIVLIAALLTYLLRGGPWKGLLLMVTAVPITVLVNVLRLVIVALGFALFDIDLSVGVVHACLGVGVFLASIVLLYSTWHVYRRLFGWQATRVAS